MNRTLTSSLLLVLAVSLGACESPRQRTSVQASNYLLNASDLDLGQVIGAAKNGRFKNGQELEAFINDPTNGVNEVDVDGDGRRDYVTVRDQGGGTLDLAVMQKGEPLTIASVTINQTTNEISGGYPTYVNGHRDHYYRDRFTVGDAMFMMWMMDATRPRFYGAPPATYRSTTVRTRTERRRVRGSSPVAKSSRSARPAGFKVKSASPARAQRATSKRASSRRLSDRRGRAGSSFGKKATPRRSFGGRKKATPRKSRSFGGGSRRSFGGRRRR